VPGDIPESRMLLCGGKDDPEQEPLTNTQRNIEYSGD
jgi:hypothetical protein